MDVITVEDPPSTETGRRVLSYVAVILLIVALAAGGYALLNREKPTPPATSLPCPGLPVGDGAALTGAVTSTGPECVGWTVEQDYSFGSADPAITGIISRIVEENVRVRDQSSVPGGKPYVRIAVFMPMTSAAGSALADTEILQSLRGAYAAQRQANDGKASELGDPTPLFQLVLANEGSDQSAWEPVADQLGTLKGGPHPLVAVTGMSISVPQTRLAAERFSALRIPAIGAVITADDMVAPWLFKVSPPNQQYTAALAAALNRQPTTRDGYLVWDRNAGDNYVQKLRTNFIATFGERYGLNDHNLGFNGSKPPVPGTPQLFSDIVRNICAVDPDIVFFSGRDRDLPAFVDALGTRGQCQRKVRPLVIATGATGLTIARDKLDAARVGVLDASSTDPVGWRASGPGTPKHYAAFARLFTAPEPAGLGFTEADLASGYAVMHRDAVVAAVWAARRDAAAKAQRNAAAGAAPAVSETPTAEDVRNALFGAESDRIPAASGALYFQEQPGNDLWPVGKPVPVIRIGAAAQDWPPGPSWTTPLIPNGT
ncbi:ABC transporter substrate-binding protein [Actinoplanes sp. NPDC051859]|uniref:ABC transporter substrate-binding protein n=1 Tax=Actinoplanes sp. NPDC051859 TaxID=3363909 RepID=UPI00379097E5